LESKIPVTTKYARKLVTADNKANIGNFKHNHMVTIAPVCKDDIMILPKDLAKNLGNICQLVLVKQIGAAIQVLDPFTCEHQEINCEKFFRYNINSCMTTRQFTKFVILSVEPVLMKERACVSTKRGHDRKSRLAECVIAREKDFGVNDTQFTVLTHLGNLLRDGDIVQGYDLTSCPWAQDEISEACGKKMQPPDVILVRKFVENKKDRMWKLKSLDVDAAEQMTTKESHALETEYEGFLQELESDKDMRANINLYKKPSKAAVATGGASMEEGSDDGSDDDDDVKLDELLNELTFESGEQLENRDVEVSVLTSEEAATVQPKVSLEDGSSTVFDAAHYDPKDFKF